MNPEFNSGVSIVGIGDAGCTAINRLINEGVNRHQIIAVNTSRLALLQSKAKTRVLVGTNLLHGNGAGGLAETGRRAAEESIDELYEVLHLADTVYLVAGMGGGTGSGALPVLARVAQEHHARTVAVVSRPFTFEGAQRQRTAETSIQRLEDMVNEVFVVRNDDLLTLVGENPVQQTLFDLAASALTWEVIRRLLP